ncbi:MAG: monovalent cation/H+ antiporter subunit D [Paracoccus denitrificans]|nr:MAG: monovalent cation/H+ antiporter subunit D [Paracoccus denitrificans]PZO83004.1 MAG: monovalent cation/H+ antiporter subunit D [Paracoccus denitrificans]
MSHWIIAPVFLPAMIGPLIILLLRRDLVGQRIVSVAATAAQLAISVGLLIHAAGGEITVYRLGNWAAPFGIVLMLDRLAALMLVLTAVVALVVQLYAIGSGWDRKGRHFHALWQFQLMGLQGAFLTGDAFNLFVFFEVLLIASYGLMIHGGGELRLRAGVQYVAYNLVGSVLFLAALGTLYSVTGTLNMADMAARIAAMPAEHSSLMRVGAALLLIVFALKAALVPLHFWLPATYANAPGPVAALFAVMTKVGLYGIIRFCTLVFAGDAGLIALASGSLLVAALLTVVLAQLGVLGSQSLGRVAAYAALASVGTLAVSLAGFDAAGLSAGLWYLIHSTLAAAALFLVADLVAARRGNTWLTPQPAIVQNGPVGALFMAAAIGIAGLPPLSGFQGKIAILQATAGSTWAITIWAVILVTSLLSIVGLTQAGSVIFWKTDGQQRVGADIGPAPSLAITAAAALVALMAGLTILGGPVMSYTQATAVQLLHPADYVDAVLTRQEGVK